MQQTASPRPPAHVLLVEPAFGGYELIRRAAALDLQLSIVTADRDDRIIPGGLRGLADQVVVADTNDVEAVIDAARAAAMRAPIDAVLPGFEYYVATAAAVASALGCPGLGVKTAMCVRNKHLMREALSAAGIAVPRFALVQTASDLEAALQSVGLPCVAKPVGFAGSIGVRKSETEADLRELCALLLERGLTDFGRSSKEGMIVEQYVSGPEYSIEGYVQDGAATYLSITEKFLSDEPYFVEVGHIVNADVSPSDRDIIISYVDRVIAALGIGLGPFHAELRLSPQGPVLMEIAARLAGDRICDLIRHATGVDLATVMLQCYLGQRVESAASGVAYPARRAGIRYFIRPELTEIESIDGLDEIRATTQPLELQMYYAPGSRVGGAVDFLHRLGHAIVVDDDYRRLKQTLSWIDDNVRIH